MPDTLPTLLRERDLVLLIFLITVVVLNIQGMEFAGTAVFFYWLLALLTFQIPSICVFGWLMHQAPPHVPVYLWILRLLREPWRSLLLFVMLWSIVLILLATIGMGLSLLQEDLPSRFSPLPIQWLVFALLLVFGTLCACFPFPLFRIVLWACGLLYLAFFGLLVVACFVCLVRGHFTVNVFPHSLATALPAHFSWSFFGLAVLALLGLNGPLFLDGEMRGANRYLRCSSRYLWCGGLGSFVLLFICTATWIALASTAHGDVFQALDQLLGADVVDVAWLLLFVGSFGSILAYLLVFSRAFLLATRLRSLPQSLARLNRAGTPIRALLLQSSMIIGAALLLFFLIPLLMTPSFTAVLHTDVIAGDQFSLLTSLTGSLWGILNALIFMFALWLFVHKYSHTWRNRRKQVGLLPGLCISGILTSLVCAIAPFMPDWPSLFLSQHHWVPLILGGIACTLALAWIVSELPRRSALVREKTQLFAREKTLREELQRTSMRERDLYTRLREAYDTQQVLLLQQQQHLKEVNQLYREQEKAAMTDSVTGLLNHRAFIERLDEILARGQREALNFLLVFLDLDHFKTINDTWGHLAGDTVLREVGQRLHKALRPGDCVGRYGGEEFALILNSATITQAYEEGEYLRHVIEADPYSLQWMGETTTGIVVTVSIGIAAYGIHGTQREELLETADLSMYQAKMDGRNCVRVAGEHTSVTQLSIPTTCTPTRCLRELVGCFVEQEENTTQLSAQALQGLVAMIQAHDATTGAHAWRLVWLSEATGYRLRASREDLFLMRLGALFHDIGKIGIPDAILHKAGSLNEEEWEVMRKHPVIGARILEQMGGFFHRLTPVVLAHHERWDGTGYPQGLKGCEIPFASRVLGVVDAYDTMISRRPYKDPMPGNAAEAELRRGSGTQFDPAVVQTFLSVLKTAPAPGQIGRSKDLYAVFDIVDGDIY